MTDAPRKNGEKTGKAMPEGKRFEPGNPGRPKGSRNKLGEAFVEALHDDFETDGVAAISPCATATPAAMSA
jgi:hypothetical protein